MVRRYHTGLARRLGQNLAHYRRRAGLTQEQLAEHIEDHSDTTGFSSNQDGGAGAGTREKCITRSRQLLVRVVLLQIGSIALH